MKIGFIGDIHGRIFHAIAAIIMWQMENDQKFDMIIQVGDFGAYPNPDEAMLKNKFILQDPTELDFSKFLNADNNLLIDLSFTQQQLNCPILFIRGNHEDFQWLKHISENGTNIASVDKLDLVRYIPDGSIIEINGIRLSFLGGIETSNEELRSIDKNVFEKLIKTKPIHIDILVTHDSPYGTGIGYTGEVQGSSKITKLVETIQPKYLISGHYHHMIGPQIIGKTKYIGLNILIPPISRDNIGCVQPGSIAVLDTDKETIEFVGDDWLKRINRDFDFGCFIKEFKTLEKGEHARLFELQAERYGVSKQNGDEKEGA